MNEASNSQKKVAAKLFSDSQEQDDFLKALIDPTPKPKAIVWLTERPAQLPFEVVSPVNFQPDFVDLVSPDEAPGKHELHDAGAYYCLDLSSVFEAVPFMAIPQRPNIILDTCSAPGGKSILAWRAHRPEWLLSNEVVVPRARILISNLKRCGVRPTKVLSRPIELLAEKFPNSMDLVIADAPCSGQSLLVKGKPNPGAFSPHTIKGNAKRQKRILQSAAKLVKPGGYLAYMTCTFSIEENEGIIERFLKDYGDFSPMEIRALGDFQSHLTEMPCYRIWPHKHLGAGGFTALLKRESAGHIEDWDFSETPALWTSV